MLFLLSILAISVFGAVMSSSAFASPEWWVEGKVIKTAEKLSSAVKVTEAITIETEELAIQCSEMKVVGGIIQPGNKNSAESLVFSSCGVVGNPECEVEDIKTKPLVFPLEGKTGKISLNFKPESGNVIAAVQISSCPLAEAGRESERVITSNEETGKGMVCEYPDVETEKTAHQLNFSGTSGSQIALGGEPASFRALVQWSLFSNEKWSAL
jgi:predicted metal-binding protein